MDYLCLNWCNQKFDSVGAFKVILERYEKKRKQAAAELGQAQYEIG